MNETDVLFNCKECGHAALAWAENETNLVSHAEVMEGEDVRISGSCSRCGCKIPGCWQTQYGINLMTGWGVTLKKQPNPIIGGASHGQKTKKRIEKEFFRKTHFSSFYSGAGLKLNSDEKVLMEIAYDSGRKSK